MLPRVGSYKLAGAICLGARLVVPSGPPSSSSPSTSAGGRRSAVSTCAPPPQGPRGRRARGRRPPRPSRAAATAATAGPAGAAFAAPPIPGRALILALFVLVDVGQALAMDFAENRLWKKSRSGTRQYVRQTVPVVSSLLSLLASLAVAVASGGASAVRQCFEPGLFITFLPVSLFLATGLSLKMLAVNSFQAGTIKIVGQLRLPAVALFSALLLSRRYSAVQWQVIALITTSCICFVWLKGQRRHYDGKAVKWTGFLQLLAWVLFNVWGGIAAERAYKIGSWPFYVQKASEDLGHLLVSAVMLLVVIPRFEHGEDVRDKERRPGGFFDSWDVRTVVTVLFFCLDAWISNLVLKAFSSLTRSVAKAFAIAVVYVVSISYAKDRQKDFGLTLAAMLVIQSSLLFSFVR